MTFDSDFHPSTHASLLQELQSTGDDGWRRFHARYQTLIAGWCRKYGPPTVSDDDAAQTVMLHLFRRLREHDHDPAKGRFRGWLHVVVKNALADLARRERQSPTVNPSLSWWGNVSEQESVEILADELAKRMQLERATEQVRARVSEPCWRAFWGHVVEGRAAREVAEELRISVGAVYQAVHRCKKGIRESYEAQKPAESIVNHEPSAPG